jgi:hypothetical protein
MKRQRVGATNDTMYVVGYDSGNKSLEKPGKGERSKNRLALLQSPSIVKRLG